MKFFAGMLQQPLNVAESFYVLQREAAIAVAEGPVFAAAREYASLPDCNWARLGMTSMLG
ncbi:hypothetical protein [Candidatus Binatus sp.]|uniref:hypothetical protein n=1 Tax=Candidatus Binatus sp. TaxID=2811406 RepID=UPI003C882F81